MTTEALTTHEIVTLGERVATSLPAELLRSRRGVPIAVDVLTGDYEIAADLQDAHDILSARRPDAAVYLGCVGGGAAFRFGAGRQRAAE